jgi:6-phosphogluconolactonase/glucosamine-6-phosphate isomerase/deaminase
MTLQVFAKEKMEALHTAKKKIQTILQKWHDSPILFLSSGGSCLPLLDAIDNSFQNQNITVGMIDERYTEESKNSNFSQVMETTWAKQASKAGVRFLSTRTKDSETLEKFSMRFKKQIQNWLEENPEGKVIATLGIGPDGHIAGILPFPKDPAAFEALFEKEKMATGYATEKTKSEHTERVTVTLPFLREKVDEAVVFAAGENKKEALMETLSKPGTLAAIPARIIHQMKLVTLFTDISL